MIAIFEFVLWVLLLPLVAFAIIGGMVIHALCEIFSPPTFFLGVWSFWAAIWFSARSRPDMDLPYQSAIESFAQSSIGPVSIPMVFFILAALFCVVSAVLRAREN